MCDLTQYGYADGNYLNVCCDCKNDFIGDKRAWRCKICAKKLLEQKVDPNKLQKEINDKQEDIVSKIENICDFMEHEFSSGDTGLEILNVLYPEKMKRLRSLFFPNITNWSADQ